MVSATGIFEVLQSGQLTVVGFGDEGMPNHFYYDECQDDLLKLITEHQCKVLAFDLSGVHFLASGILGLFSWIRSQRVEVHLYNPSPVLRSTLTHVGLSHLVFDQNTDRIGNSAP